MEVYLTTVFFLCVKTNRCCVRTEIFTNKDVCGGPGSSLLSLPGPGPMISTEIISNLQHPLLTESPTIIRLSASHCGVYPVKQFLSNLYCCVFLAGKYCHIQRPEFSYQISSMSGPENSGYTLLSSLQH